MTAAKRRNGAIELSRFLFSIVIILWHARKLCGGGEPSLCGESGYIAVEFFFLVSGWLIASKVEREEKRELLPADALHFLGSKLRGLLPVYIFAVSFAAVKILVLEKLSLKAWLFRLLCAAWDILLLRISGVVLEQVVRAIWYVSAMLIAGVIIYLLLRKFGDWFYFVIAPLGALALLGYLFQKQADLNLIVGHFGIVAPGLVRALAEMSLGCVLYRFSMALKKVPLSLFSRLCLSAVNLICIYGVLKGCTKMPHERFDYIMLLLLAMSVTLMFSEQTLYFIYHNETLDRIAAYLGGLSMSIYLNHMWIKDIITALTKGWSYRRALVLFVASVLAVSALCLLVCKGVAALVRKYKTPLRRIFIKEAA